MPTLWERTVFFATGQLPQNEPGTSISGDAKPLSIAAQIRDELLGQSLDMMTEWKAALGRASSDDERSELRNFYKNQLGVLNGAFDAVRAADPTINTQINIDQVEYAVGRQTHGQSEDHTVAVDARLERSEKPKFALLHELGQAGIILPANQGKQAQDYDESAEAKLRERVEASHATDLLPDVSRERLILEQFDTGELAKNGLPLNAHEYPGRVIQAQMKEQEFAALLVEQATDIRAEWQRDLESGSHNQHALESYFAGKVDQHNTLIEMAVEAHPELQPTLPPPINYVALRDDLQQQIEAAKEQQIINRRDLAVAGYGVSI